MVVDYDDDNNDDNENGDKNDDDEEEVDDDEDMMNCTCWIILGNIYSTISHPLLTPRKTMARESSIIDFGKI